MTAPEYDVSAEARTAVARLAMADFRIDDYVRRLLRGPGALFLMLSTAVG